MIQHTEDNRHDDPIHDYAARDEGSPLLAVPFIHKRLSTVTLTGLASMAGQV